MKATGKIVKWQQIELPEIKPLVHQWELHESCCPHCKLIAMPELEKEETYLLGPRLEAFVNVCLGRFRMGHRIVREFIATLLPVVDLSQGLISKIKIWQHIEECVEGLLASGPGKKVERFFRKMQKGWKHFRIYLRSPDYPLTNNPAEEALRSLVIARKLCFGSRSEYGKSWRAAIQSCVETLRRNGLSVLDFVADAIQASRSGSSGPNICSVYPPP